MKNLVPTLLLYSEHIRRLKMSVKKKNKFSPSTLETAIQFSPAFRRGNRINSKKKKKQTNKQTNKKLRQHYLANTGDVQYSLDK